VITVYSDRHRLHHGRGELNDGALVPAFERETQRPYARPDPEAEHHADLRRRGLAQGR